MLYKEEPLTWNGAIFLIGDATAQKIPGWYKLTCLVLMLLEQTRLPILQFVPHLSCQKAALCLSPSCLDLPPHFQPCTLRPWLEPGAVEMPGLPEITCPLKDLLEFSHF